MKQISVKLNNDFFSTKAVDAMRFDLSDPSVIEICRAFDGEVKLLRDKLKHVVLDGIDDDALLKCFHQLEPLCDELNDLKKHFYDHFISSIKNTDKLGWLHLEPSTKRLKGPLNFVFPDGMLRWRLGLAKEKRIYCDLPMIENKAFQAFLVQEPIEIQSVILEFERAKIQLWILSLNLRSQFIEVCHVHKNYQSIKRLQNYYHSLKGKNNA